MKIFVDRQKTSFGVMAAAVLMLVFTAVLLLSNLAFAEDTQVKAHDGETLLTINENGNKKVVVAAGGTIGDAIKKAGIEINENDNVEPGLDQELIASEYKVNIYRTRPVIIVDGFAKRQITTALQTPQQIVDEANIEIRDEDNLKLEKADLFQDGAGLKVLIERAKPIKVVLFGKEATMYTHANTVQEFLDEKEISLGAEDRVSMDLDADLDASDVLRIWREGRQTITVEEEVEFSVKNEYDADRAVGYSSVKQEGVTGLKLVTYDVVIVDGEIAEKTAVSEVVTRQSVERVVVVGIKSNYLPYTGGGTKTDWLAASNIPKESWGYADFMVQRESSWNPNAVNASSGACGLAQALPCSKMPGNWRDPVNALNWMNDYVNGRYYDGSPYAAGLCRGISNNWNCAYVFWTNKHWY